MNDVSVAVALGAGLLSFLSPCVLPLIPGYLSFVSGAGIDELKSGSKRAGVLWRTLFFIAGFTAVFVALGVAFSGGAMLSAGRANRALSVAAGAVVVILGLNTMFGFIKFLNMEAKAHVSAKPTSAAGAFVVGMAFGAGWTPCVGPILASILFMAARAGGAARAVLLLGAYSAGLAVPFIAAGLFFERLNPLWAWFKRHGRGVRIVSGLLLIAIGLSMALGRLSAFNAAFARLGIALKGFSASRPESLSAWTIGIAAASIVALVAVPAIRRRPILRPARVIAVALLAAALVVELSGATSIGGWLASWLMFQGV